MSTNRIYFMFINEGVFCRKLGFERGSMAPYIKIMISSGTYKELKIKRTL